MDKEFVTGVKRLISESFCQMKGLLFGQTPVRFLICIATYS